MENIAVKTVKSRVVHKKERSPVRRAMLSVVLSWNYPDIRARILRHLDEATLLRCRLVESALKKIVDECGHTLKCHLSDRKLRAGVLSGKPVLLVSDSSSSPPPLLQGKELKKLVVGKLLHSLRNAPLHCGWESIGEIEFTRPVTSKNFYALLGTCSGVHTLRVNYLAIGGHKRVTSILRRFLPTRFLESSSYFAPQKREMSLYLPNLRSIYVDRGLDTSDFIANRGRNQFKHFDADLYFKTMAALIDDLEREVQLSILEMLRLQLEKNQSLADDPSSGFFFTKPSFVNRFPMNTQVLNSFVSKLRS